MSWVLVEVAVELRQALGERVDVALAPDLQLDRLALPALFAGCVGLGPAHQQVDTPAADASTPGPRVRRR
jgi:hypothetical protein